MYYTPQQLLVWLALLLALGACSQAPKPHSVTLETHPYRAGGAANLPWVAGQDGSGAWQILSGQDGRYTLEVGDPAGRYSLAVACTSPALQNARIYLVHATLAELRNPVLNCYFPQMSGQTRTVSGKISSFGDTEWALVQVTGTTSLDGPEVARPEYWVEAPLGSQRLVALGYRRDDTLWASRAILKPLSVNEHQSLDLDLGHPSTQTQRYTIRAEGVGTDTLIQDTKFHSPANVYNPDLGKGAFRGANFHHYGGIPVAWQLPEDSHLAYVEAYTPGGSQGRSTTAIFKEPRDLTLTLLPHLGQVQVEPVTGESTRYRLSWDRYQASFYTAEVIETRSRWISLFTPGWLEGSAYIQPELAGLPGWQAAWGLPAASSQTRLRFAAVRVNRPTAQAIRLSGLNFPGTQSDGLVWQSAARELKVEP